MRSLNASKFHPSRFLHLFALINTLLFYLLGVNFLKITFSSSSFFETSFYVYENFAGKLLVVLFALMTYLGQFALIAFAPCIILLPLFVIFKNKWFVLPISILVWSLLSCLLLTDSIIFSLFHFHLNPTLLKVLADQDFQILQLTELNPLEIKIITATGLGIFLFETIFAYISLKKSVAVLWTSIAKQTTIALFSCLFLSYITFIITIANSNNVLAQQTPNFPLYNQVLSFLLPLKDSSNTINLYTETRFSQPLFPEARIKYPLQPLRFEKQKKPYNILLIAIDTWRFDSFNQELTPHLYDLSRKSWIFNHHLSGGNSTQAGLFSLFYGISSNYWSAMMKYKQGALLVNEAIKQNYDVRILFSSFMRPPFNKTIFLEVQPLRITHAGGKTIADNDRAITQEFKQFIDKRDDSRPFFIFLFYDAAHNYFAKQNIPSVYPVKGKDGQRLMDIKSKADIIEMYNRYRNAIRFIDNEINKVLESLKEKKLLENTIVIVTSDHGEEFNDYKQNYWGHGSNYTPLQIQVPLIISQPGQSFKRFNHLTSHYDIAPYLMSQVLGCQNPIADYSIGENLQTAHQTPFILVGSYINMSIVEPTKNTTLLTSGGIVVADNNAKILSQGDVDKNILKQALWLMRKFFEK